MHATVQSGLTRKRLQLQSQTLEICAVNIYFQINVKKKFQVFVVDAPLHRRFGTHLACDIRPALTEVINISSSQLVICDWIASAQYVLETY